MSFVLCRRFLQAWLFWVVMSTAFSFNPLKMLTSRIPKLNVRLEKIEPCPEPSDTPILFEDFRIDQVGFNDYVLGGKIIIKETLDEPARLEVEMYRCSEKDNPDSCEYYFTFKKNGLCEKLELGDKDWQYFTNKSNLPSKCPILPNTYSVDGASLNLKYLKYLPIIQSYWRLKNRCYMGEKLMFCADTEISLEMRLEQ